MNIFTKEISGVKYTVHYKFRKSYLYPVTYDVEIIKSTYKKSKQYKNILTNWNLKVLIENHLHMAAI